MAILTIKEVKKWLRTLRAKEKKTGWHDESLAARYVPKIYRK